MRLCGASLVALVLACGPRTLGEAGETAGATSTSSGSSGSSTADTTSPGTSSSTSSAVDSSSTSTSNDATTTSGDSDPAPDVGFPGCPNEWQPPECWVYVCDLFPCGEVYAMFDDDGCPREVCESDDDCLDGEDCRALLMSRACAPFGGPESCNVGQDGCVCGGTLSCGGDPRGFCLDATAFPPDEACRALTIDCHDLDPWFIDGYYSLTEVMDEMSPELRAEALQCQADYVARLIDECGGAVCEVLCQENSVAGCPGKLECAELCAMADPAAARTLALVLAGDPTACSDCATCPEGDELCASLWGCG